MRQSELATDPCQWLQQLESTGEKPIKIFSSRRLASAELVRFSGFMDGCAPTEGTSSPFVGWPSWGGGCFLLKVLELL